MGKASSSKKVARAARAGGRVSSGQPRSLLFPGVLVLVFVLGTSLVAFARHDRNQTDIGGVPQIGDHIHQAIGVNICGEWQPELPGFESRIGIHTHSDGVIHIHPFSQLGVGANATLDRYLRDARDAGGLDFSLSGSKLEYLGEVAEEGVTECEGVSDPQLRVAYWSNVQDPDSSSVITTGGFGDIRLTEDGAGLTIFYGDPRADIPQPPNAQQLTALGAIDGGEVPDPEGDTPVDEAPDPEATTTTTAP